MNENFMAKKVQWMDRRPWSHMEIERHDYMRRSGMKRGSGEKYLKPSANKGTQDGERDVTV